MLESLLVVAGQVATLFLMMAVGFVLVKREHLTRDGLGQMSHLLLYVVSPCIIIRAMETENDPQLLRDLGVGVLTTVAFYVVLGVLAPLFFRKKEENTRIPLQFSLVYANVGFMGLPLIQAVLGEEALIFCAMYLVVFTIAQWTHGVALMGGKGAASIKKAVLNPGVLGLVVGLPLFLTGFRLPPMADNAVSFLADLNTPLAMVVIGGQMAFSDFSQTFRRRELYAASALRLIAAPLLTALALLPFHLDPLLYSTSVILAGAPAAGVTSIFSQKFGRDTAAAAQAVTLSTLLSILTLPIFAVLAALLSG